MAFEIPGLVISLPAGADLSGDQFQLVELAADGNVDPVAAVAGNPFIGVLQNNPSNIGDACTIMVSGVSKVIAGDTCTVGDELVSDDVVAGSVEPLAAGAAQRIIGRCLITVADTELTSVLIGHGAPITHA